MDADPKTLPLRHDWDYQTLVDDQRFYSFAGLWKRNKREDYDRTLGHAKPLNKHQNVK